MLDLGIGTGASLNYYPDRGRIIGVDLSAGMLREARKKIRERHMERTILFQANALELPFGDNTFDTIVVSHVISVVSDPAKVVREARAASPSRARGLSLSTISRARIDSSRFWKSGSVRSAPSSAGGATWRCRI